jgi:hypothetical protein
MRAMNSARCMARVQQGNAIIMTSSALRLACVLLVATFSPSFVAAAVTDEQFKNVVRRLQILEDREAIRHLLEKYIEFNESRDYRAYSGLFASNGELKLRRGGATGPANIFEFMQTNFGAPLSANSMLRDAAHVLSNVIIEVDGDAAIAHSRWALLSPSKEDGTPRVAQSGFYTDKLVREKGEWKFLQRVVTPGIPVPAAEKPAP